MAEKTEQAVQAQPEVADLQQQNQELQAQVTYLQELYTKKAKQFENLVSLYNVLVDRIINQGVDK